MHYEMASLISYDYPLWNDFKSHFMSWQWLKGACLVPSNFEFWGKFHREVFGRFLVKQAWRKTSR